MPQDTRDQLLGRHNELETLDRLLREVRGGRSRVLVLRGEAGIGKSALLDYLATRAARMQTVRAAGVEAESDFAYSALQGLCAPLLSHLDRLPQVQQEALRVAFGLSAGNPPEMLLVGLAVLGLFSEAAAESPLVCLVDDAQWLDLMSQRILAFVGRRLDAESVALVFAERVSDVEGDGDEGLSGLPTLLVRGRLTRTPRALLDSALPGPVDDRVRDRIVVWGRWIDCSRPTPPGCAMASYMTRPGRDAVQPLLAAAAQLRDLDSAAARKTCLSALGAAMWTGRVDPDGLRRTVEAAAPWARATHCLRW